MARERWHGTAGGYTNHRCRCNDCREAWRIACYRRSQKRKQLPIPNHVHGSPNGYGNYGCRCRPCTDAYTDETRDRNERREARTSS